MAWQERESIDKDEKVVEIDELVFGNPTGKKLYAIRDDELGYWRGEDPLSGSRAWTREKDSRATWPSRREAELALASIRELRQVKDRQMRSALRRV